MTKANEGILAGLHGILAQSLIDKIKDGTATASDLSVARQFLKDNGINADAGSNDGLKRLTDELPEDLDNVTHLYGG